MTRMRKTAASLTLLLGLSGCGDGPVGPEVDVPDLAGRYSGNWTLQVLRTSDRFRKSFACRGTLTLSQGPGFGSVASLSGFAVVLDGNSCKPESFDVTGTVDANGAITLTTGGPPPTEGPCPGGSDVHYSGQVVGRSLSARGVTRVQCPQFGEHEFTYLMDFYKN